MFSLKRQSEMEFSYKPFQADKAILYLSPDHAKLLCSNKSANGWSTIGNYQVKFESWDPNLHSFLSVIPSYGGWLRFRVSHFTYGTTRLFIALEWLVGTFLQWQKKPWSWINSLMPRLKLGIIIQVLYQLL